MQQRNIVVTIMAGGAGTRFWPMSREERPKQFINLTGERTMLQETRARLEDLVPPERILVLTNARYADLAREQLPDLPPENVVGEPMLRDTAAAVALSAAISERRWPGSVQAVLAADHIIRPSSRFQEILLSAAEAADEEGGLYTFGIVPRHPATGYGYLERGEQVGARYGAPHFRLKRFCEKPSREIAEQFVASGDFYWNSGIFVWKSADILAEVATHLPEHYERIVAAASHFGQPGFDAALTTAFEPLKKISIDFGVMEKAQNVRCVAADFEWNDVGGWLALEQVLPRDSDGNWTQARLLALDSRDNIVVSEESGHRIVAIGVSDLVVVHTAGATLVCRKDEAERIKAAVERLREMP